MTTTTNTMTTPQDVIDAFGITPHWTIIGPSRITQGVHYQVQLRTDHAERDFDWHSSKMDEAMGITSLADVLECLLADALYVTTDDVTELADELHAEGEDGKPSELLAMARQLIENRRNLAAVLGVHPDGVADIAGCVEW